MFNVYFLGLNMIFVFRMIMIFVFRLIGNQYKNDIEIKMKLVQKILMVFVFGLRDFCKSIILELFKDLNVI